MPDGQPSVSVVMPVRNEGCRVREAVSSIVEGRSKKFGVQIVLVDDASSDGACEPLAGDYSWRRDEVRVDVIRLPQWSGIPRARNVGAGAALSKILFITDANVRFPVNWDLPIRAHLGPNRALCATIADINSPFRGYGCTLHLPSMTASWLRSAAIHGGYVPVSPCTGTIISAELFQRIGGYDTGMPVYGAAEPEFSVRLWLAGAEIVVLPNLVLHHRFRPASERQPFLAAISLLQIYNYLRFGLIYLDQLRTSQMFRYYAAAAPHLFETALRRVWASDVWVRRASLMRRLPGQFASFASRFCLPGA
jgi:glycosyltransferase involved in cell wall biosynthesis